ncbi:MAG: FAD binding domain-containing protein [Actinomycetota bacterium]
MTIALDLTYLAPTSLEEVLAVLAANDGQAVPLAGGTDVVANLRDDLLQPSIIVDLKRLPGMASLEPVDDELHIGCLVTFSELLASPLVRDRYPLLHEMAGMVASVGVRNRATVVGNICSAVPSCDAGPVLLALDAQVHLVGPTGPRTVPIDRWFEGPRRTAIRSGEIVTHLSLPEPDPSHGAAFARLSRTRGEDLAQASVAVVVTCDRPYSCRVAFGAVAPTAVRARRIEVLLDEQGLGEEAIEAAVGLVDDEVAPISDVRASARYRLRMCEVMLRRALETAAARAADRGPAYGTRLM